MVAPRASVFRLRFAGLAALGLLALAGGSGVARADETRFGRYDVQTLFAVGKNTNKNEVQYGIRLDQDCLPVGDAPVYAYWRDYEKGPTVTSDLTVLDRSVYGIKSQTVVSRSPEESKVVMTVRSTERPIAVFTHKQGGRCVGETVARINGISALMNSVFVHLAGLFSVDWVEIKGTANGRPVIEHIKH
jgi:hypothetical protein